MVFTSFGDLVKQVFAKSEIVALFATIVWSVWYHRNKTQLNESTRPLDQIAGFARDYIRDFNSLKRNSPSVHKIMPRRSSPPAHDIWKINFDGAMFW